MVQIFHLNARAPGRRNVLGLVTFLAGYSLMFSFKWIPSLVVIKGFFLRGIPVNHIKIRAVMIGMALRALLARGIRPREGGMQASFIGNAIADFRVASQTLQLRFAAPELVALGAVRRSAELLVRSGKRTGRNLCASGRRVETCQNGKNGEKNSTSNEDDGSCLNGLHFCRHRVSGNLARAFGLGISNQPAEVSKSYHKHP